MSEQAGAWRPLDHGRGRAGPEQALREPPALDRLAALHDEAAETTRLANLLGRTPWLAAVLTGGAFAVFAYAAGFVLEPAPALWTLFVSGGALAAVRFYRQAVRAPFELLALRAFHGDLKAALLYSGFAWGAGLFFAGPEHNLLILLIFSVGMPALAELVLRSPVTALYFALPAILTASVAVAVGPLGAAPALMIGRGHVGGDRDRRTPDAVGASFGHHDFLSRIKL
jgi:hypothetical protein